MINTLHLLHLVVRPVLNTLNMGGEVAETLMLATAAQESAMGQYLKQIGGGPALGMFMMEPATHDDIWKNYLDFHPDLAEKMKFFCLNGEPSSDQLCGNLYYACAMARLKYYQSSEPLPTSTNPLDLFAFYKKVYNTADGAATEEEFCKNFVLYVVTKH